MKFSTLILVLILSISFSATAQKEMTNKKMHSIFKKEASSLEGDLGAWQLEYGGHLIIAITDENANRMRLFTPVLEAEKLERGQMRKMLEANFHSALDAKYSLYKELVVSVFTHPLKELTEEQLIDAMRQVVTLAQTFGTSYTSTDWVYGSGFEKPKVNKSPSKDKKN